MTDGRLIAFLIPLLIVAVPIGPTVLDALQSICPPANETIRLDSFGVC